MQRLSTFFVLFRVHIAAGTNHIGLPSCDALFRHRQHGAAYRASGFKSVGVFGALGLGPGRGLAFPLMRLATVAVAFFIPFCDSKCIKPYIWIVLDF